MPDAPVHNRPCITSKDCAVGAHWLRGVEKPLCSQLMDSYRRVEPAQVAAVGFCHVCGTAPASDNPAMPQRVLPTIADQHRLDMQYNGSALSSFEMVSLYHDGMHVVANKLTWRWTPEERCIQAAWAPSAPATGKQMSPKILALHMQYVCALSRTRTCVHARIASSAAFTFIPFFPIPFLFRMQVMLSTLALPNVAHASTENLSLFNDLQNQTKG